MFKIFKRKKRDTALVLIVENIEPGHQHIGLGSRVGKSEIIELNACTAQMSLQQSYEVINQLETTGREVARKDNLDFEMRFK